MTTATATPSDARSILRAMLSDPWVMTAIVWLGVLLVFPSDGTLSPTLEGVVHDYISTNLLFVLAIGALWRGTGSHVSRREQWFWRLAAIAFTLWLAGDWVSYYLMQPDNVTVGVVIDVLYLNWYLTVVLALDLQPQVAGNRVRLRPLQLLAASGRFAFVVGLFGYFVLLPRTTGIEEYLSWFPSFSLYVLLDGYLTLRFLQAAWRTRDPRWRASFAIFGLAHLWVMVADSWDLAWLADLVPDDLSDPAYLFWYAPPALYVVGVRINRAIRLRGESRPDPDTKDEQARGVPLLVYSMGFAIIHLVISFARSVEGGLADWRIILVVVGLLVFMILHVIQNEVIRRWVEEQNRLREEAEDRIRFLAHHDPQTGLLNLRAFEAEFERAIARSDRNESVVALLFVDIDHFKKVNDQYGHRAGDCVLREAAARLRACTREVDTLARYGGDEFVVVLESLDNAEDAETVARRIVAGFARGFSYESAQVELSASIGIATSNRTGWDPSELIEAADRAMYAVKRSGGGGAGVA